MRILRQAKGFLQGVRSELKKVTWTSKKELVESTIVVVVAVIILAVFLGVVDYLMQFLVLGGRFSIVRLLAR